MTTEIEGPYAGSRCLAAPATSNTRWAPATVRRVNEDGTFKIEFDVKQMTVLPYWFGVTPAEISFEDSSVWPDVFARLIGSESGLSRADFAKALTLLGFLPNDEQLLPFWRQNCKKLANIDEECADRHVFDEVPAYNLFLEAGISAKQCIECLTKTDDEWYAKVYWNNVRMGGRRPSEISRSIELDDAFAAFGVSNKGTDTTVVQSLESVETKQKFTLPAVLKQFLSQRGIAKAVAEVQPNWPELMQGRGKDEWTLFRDMRHKDLKGDFAIAVMSLFDVDWYAVFDDGENDARIYVRWDSEGGEGWSIAAPSIAMFFWDLAQTGLAWYQDTKYQGGKAVKRTDVGLVLA